MKSLVIENIKEFVRSNFEKEYYCHVQFVVSASRDLQRQYGGELDVVLVAALMHDIGRINGGDNKDHPARGAIRAIPILQQFGFTSSAIEMIADCIRMHNRQSGFRRIEEEVVANADALSKLFAHDAFLLLTNADGYFNRAKWGLKYLEKGYWSLSLPGLQDEHRELYQSLREKYLRVIAGR